MKILLAADGSRFTQGAARYLVRHLQWFAKPPEVHVFHVHPSSPYPGAATSADAVKIQLVEEIGAAFAIAQKDLIASVVEKYQRSESEIALAVAQKELLAAEVPHTSAWMVGDVALLISKYVKEHAIDLVIMGTHGHGALANLALGSVVTKSIASLEVPIIVVRSASRTSLAQCRPARKLPARYRPGTHRRL